MHVLARVRVQDSLHIHPLSTTLHLHPFPIIFHFTCLFHFTKYTTKMYLKMENYSHLTKPHYLMQHV